MRPFGVFLLTGISVATVPAVVGSADQLLLPQEQKHLKNVQLLTFVQDVEAYFSVDDKQLIFQPQCEGVPCDQIYTMPVETAGGKPATAQFVSTGKYQAEATITRDGQHIVFASTPNGDRDIFTMDADGSNVKQLTGELGYDGGPFWSYHGTKIVYRAEHPKTPEEEKDYKDLLAQGLIQPGNLEIWVINADGSDKHQVTHHGAANLGLYGLPDGKPIILASNQADPKNGRDFELYIKNEAGTEQQRITYPPDFDGFPMFTSNGKPLVWASNRNARVPHETNVFIADGVE
jgi:Tol biopolymer transport system component